MMRLKIEMSYKCGFLRYEVSKSGKINKIKNRGIVCQILPLKWKNSQYYYSYG